MRHHGKGDMAVPTVPVPNFVLVSSRLAFPFLNTLFYSEAGRSHLPQFQQGYVQGALDR